MVALLAHRVYSGTVLTRPYVHLAQTVRDHGGVHQPGLVQGPDEVEVLLPVGAQLRHAQVFRLQAPADELRPPRRRRRIRVLDPHQPVPPPGRQDRRVEVDAIDAEPVLLLKR